MTEPRGDSAALASLREDLSKEYYGILTVVSGYDGWILVVKGWSATLSLAALGLAFQQQHFAMFALAAITGIAFWFLDGLMKGFQYRYYVRMREIEYTAYLINAVRVGGEFGEGLISAPRIDMTWGFKGYPVGDDGVAGRSRGRVTGRADETGSDWRAEEPERRKPHEIYSALRGRFWWSNVALPHAAAVLLGIALFIAAALDAPGLEQLPL